MSNIVKWVCYDQNNLLSHAFVTNLDLLALMWHLCREHKTLLCQDNFAETVTYVKQFSISVRIF